MLTFIARGFEYRDRDVLLQLYRALVRSHLEYYARFWCPYLRKDVLAIEGVQQRFSRLFPGMAGLSYEERLSRLGLYSLDLRRVRGDLIETYKILTRLERMDSERVFPMVGESRTRGHNLRIRGKSFRTEVRRNVFTQRVVNVWNSVPLNVVEAKTLSDFKKKLDLRLKGSRDMGGRGGSGY